MITKTRNKHVNKRCNPGDRNVMKKQAEKIFKYEDLSKQKVNTCRK